MDPINFLLGVFIAGAAIAALVIAIGATPRAFRRRRRSSRLPWLS
jgi:hypothetical protein